MLTYIRSSRVAMNIALHLAMRKRAFHLCRQSGLHKEAVKSHPLPVRTLAGDWTDCHQLKNEDEVSVIEMMTRSLGKEKGNEGRLLRADEKAQNGSDRRRQPSESLC
uniref:Uncharacterized protein n=1 Tax=Opuntia streptacantha TaxID=393608 RepID=A0A7C9EP35_OPUST